MKKLILAAGAAAIATLIAGGLQAQQPQTGAARIKFPANYKADFTLYNVVDRFDGKHARFTYIDKKSLAAAKPGEPLPDGTYLLLEMRDVELDAAGNPALDAEGRMRPKDSIRGFLVQEKKKGYGDAIKPELRNGDWDYAVFKADGTVNEAVASVDGCFSCHLNSRKDRDFTFTAFKNIQDGVK